MPPSPRHAAVAAVNAVAERWPSLRPLTASERRSGPLAASEEAFQRHVLRLASLCGWLAYHTRDSRRSHAGFPDLVLVRRERVIWAELKGATTPVTNSQLAWLVALDQHGREVYVWRSGRDEVDAIHAILK